MSESVKVKVKKADQAKLPQSDVQSVLQKKFQDEALRKVYKMLVPLPYVSCFIQFGLSSLTVP